MAVNVNENGSIKDLGVHSNLDWNGIEYLGEQTCVSYAERPTPIFDLPRPLSDYKYMILFGHIYTGSYDVLSAGVIVFSPVDIYNNNGDYKRIYPSFLQSSSASGQYIAITDLTASSLTTFKQGKDGSFQRLYGIY